MLGTPDYTAPEQLKGGEVDHRADIYSLGVMFYEMLTGDLPRGAWELPSKRTPAASTRLDEVVTRAMQSEPDKRYQHASEVRTAVEEARIAQPATERVQQRTTRFTTNNVLTCLMTGLFVLMAFLSPTGDALTFLMLGGPFLALAFFFRMKRRPAGIASAFVAGMAASAALVMGISKIHQEQEAVETIMHIHNAGTDLRILREENGFSDDHPQVRQLLARIDTLRFRSRAAQEAAARALDTAVRPSTPPVPSPRAVADLNAVINELADSQPVLDYYKKRGVTRYWTGDEEEGRGAWLKQLAAKVSTRTAAGFAPEDPRVKEARQRLSALEEAHRAMKLPGLSPGNCVNPEYRGSHSAAGSFPDGEVIPGVRLAFWQGKHEADCAAYYVEPLGIEPEKPLSYEERTLEDYPEFWPLDMPLERPRMLIASPHSNAEMEWLMQQFPKETAADSVGLSLATFDTGFDGPQLSWMHWSRSSDDRIPWAAGEPRSAVGSEKGRLILKGGKCYTVFDTAPRPQLFGGGYVDVIVWAARLMMHAGIPGVGGALLGEEKGPPGTVAANRNRALSTYQDFISPEAVPYQAEVARTDPPWRQWKTDVSSLRTVAEMRAGKNTGDGIPFHRLPGSRVLATRLVCSREFAEKLAAHCGARLPTPQTQQELDALASILPDKFPVHAGYQRGNKVGNLMREERMQSGATGIAPSTAETTVPDGRRLTIFRWESNGVLRSVASRALLMLEWPDK